MKRIFALAGGLAVLALAGCNSGGTGDNTTGGNGTASTGKRYNIAMIPKGTTHVYWKSCKAGADKAAKELGVDINWKGPLKENDRTDQISIVRDFTSQKVDGIIVAPLDDVALAPPIKKATEAGVPVVLFDSGLAADKATPGKDFVSLVATNNEKGGELGGERLAELIGKKGKVVLLRCQEGSASTLAREKGFLTAMAKYPGITLLEKDTYGGSTVDEAKAKAIQLMDKIGQADGVFSSNESTTVGLMLALKQAGFLGKKKFVGFDTSPTLIDGLKAKQIDALVAQDPTKMGYEAVKAMVGKLKGESEPTNMDTGVTVVDNANLNTPAVQTVLQTP